MAKRSSGESFKDFGLVVTSMSLLAKLSFAQATKSLKSLMLDGIGFLDPDIRRATQVRKQR